jgi:hypothetical protein
MFFSSTFLVCIFMKRTINFLKFKIVKTYTNSEYKLLENDGSGSVYTIVNPGSTECVCTLVCIH